MRHSCAQADVLTVDEDGSVPVLMAPWAAAFAASCGLANVQGAADACWQHDSHALVSVSRIAVLASNLHQRTSRHLGTGRA